jgi:hypothetical protein
MIAEKFAVSIALSAAAFYAVLHVSYLLLVPADRLELGVTDAAIASR